ncbi:Nucleotide-diphospho-sugar transferase [Seminavis robusta]|uniref:Nucleotide-diphospho-sugar transferase n=1 Tax=Seminavis robusta TaxID=568900 RepID=A0A9N8DFU7_9STRA|nr:Nucleotide-diphospho-sugar transferase [Seminavis robusta]|eukprot:Sro130_g061930.1 Nucleotide-diphospho-sugar transferase (565) ;mRNA; f:55819-58062
MMGPPNSSRPRRKPAVSVRTVVTFAIFGVCCFYAGVLVGAHTMGSNNCSHVEPQQTPNKEAEEPRFPADVSTFAAGMALVPRAGFMERFEEMGFPLDEPNRHNNQVLLLYSHDEALPPKSRTAAKSNTHIPVLENVSDATENCDTLNIILSQPGDKQQCFAILGQFRSHHVTKFMRLPLEGPLDHQAPLRLVNRGAQASGRVSMKTPTAEETKVYWETLQRYLNTLDATLDLLQPLAQKVAQQNTVIVMVCNHGQSELLMNFVCASRSRGVDLSTVLVFATDKETKELAEGFGLTSFYDETNYADIPMKAAGRYADVTFSAMMMAKVYCVQQVVLLGYDVLFLDVDIVLYKDPLQFFHDTASPYYNHDIYFQDDGSRALFYAPYSANTGMYYIRNNDKTKYFFNSLLLGGDLITATHSHQIALVSLLSEHASLYGLKVKVFARRTSLFPGGYSFHNHHDFMKELMGGKVDDAILFHMSWTTNKKDKEKFLRQMGNWFVQDKCVGSTASKILGKDDAIAIAIESKSLLEPCCLKEPNVSCFYKDKPSKIPCKDSPALDKRHGSFW